MSHPSDLRRGSLGNVHWDADKKTATIRVLDASDYQMSFSATLKDMEFTVVHELTHLELSSMTRNFKSRSEESVSEEERAVNRLSDAMINSITRMSRLGFGTPPLLMFRPGSRALDSVAFVGEGPAAPSFSPSPDTTFLSPFHQM